MRRAAFSLVTLVAVLATSSSTQSTPQTSGAVAAWQAMLKLRTTASVMHVTAHPDDEHGGVLAKLSRGDGARVALLTLNRGESGDNAIGPQLFDALGLIRTEELLQANRYYGVDEQYFTSVVDYGYSKTLEESLRQWGRDTVLRDVVRIIRMSRPTVILSRFQGNERDGHGNHSTAGVMAVEAFRAAADPARYPEQIAEGLRPWQAQRVFIGGVRANEDWTVRIDSGEYSQVLGDSYDNIARYGLSFQRSQTSGRFAPTVGANYGHYKLVDAVGPRTMPAGPLTRTQFTGLFEGLPTTLEATIGTAGKEIDAAVMRAVSAFALYQPSAAAPALAEGLRLTRAAIDATKDADLRFHLAIKEQQFQDAINASLGVVVTALAEPPLMGAPVAGQTFNVSVRATNRSNFQLDVTGGSDDSPVRIQALPGWNASSVNGPSAMAIYPRDVISASFAVTVAGDAALSTKPYFSRNSLKESRYVLSDPSQFGKPVSQPPLTAVVRYSLDGVTVEARKTVKRREAKLPYGEVTREVRNVPRLAVSMTPAHAIVPMSAAPKPLEVEVSLLHNAEAPTSGAVTLRMPPGWSASPASQPFSFARAGERASYRFTVSGASSGVGSPGTELEFAL